ncbi:serine hydrolase domain-containing protein [[Muricauda] lutisoli]|uniref:Beta-lactamase family protein n=1 Tax=[Muricauda] lutisoli TaxID=2816035 RepID=A0ABS3EZB3_9FLAO|nr:serine hydrolase domain-containing protein [[Muricauda] lutisoli]MBO0331457.1 beta-lactamase family protein [[Muricauda] lutisoli]
MRYCLIVFSLILCLACAEQENAPKNGGLSPKMESVRDSLDTYFSKLTGLQKFNGVVLAYKQDTLLLKKAYNLDSDIQSSTYVTDSTQFDIHSVSKLMTYYLVAKLEVEDKLHRNQTLDMFFEDFPKGKDITLQMLLDHSSGLPRELMDLEGEEYSLTSDQIVEFAKKQPFLFQPGTDVQYSNIGYEILYNIISKAYQKPFAQCVVDEIFEPIGMDGSGAHFFVEENRVKNMAQNHVLKDSLVVEVANIQRDEFRTARLFSTVDDLKKFMDHVKQEPYASFLKNENGTIAKDGGSKGIRAQVYSDLVNDFDFVVLANYDQMPFFDTIEDIVKILKSEPVEYPKEIHRKAIVLDKEVLERYEGSYTFADFDGLVLDVKVEGDYLVIFQDGEKIGTLQAETPTVFFENPKAAESFEFVENESGTYDALMGWKGIVVEGKRN